MYFIGREQELARLEALLDKGSASLVILKGRRRIGKSRLVEEFAKDQPFIRISGIPPTRATTAESERAHFAHQLSTETGLPPVTASNWQSLFSLLAEKIATGKLVVLLDEISWMGSKDADFLGLLKDAWDYQFSKNHQLVMILCGSVSSWIENEIVNSTAFLGRPCLYMTLQQLSLVELDAFWKKNKFNHFSTYEKLKILSITGGVPRYLELLNSKETAEWNIKQLCFYPSSPLLGEYDRIFSDVFGVRSSIYKKIIMAILDNSLEQSHILEKLQREKSGTFSDYLSDLIKAGFIRRDFNWSFKTGRSSKKSRYSIKDNFIRFYLKFLEPNKERIEEGLMVEESLGNLPGWFTTLGLQFENLVLNNVKCLLPALNVKLNDVVNFGPYYQKSTKKTQGCQIDLLIQTKMHLLFVCEIKFSKNPVNIEVVNDVKMKMKALDKPKGISILPILIHVNGVSDSVVDSQFFYRIIDFNEFLSY